MTRKRGYRQIDGSWVDKSGRSVAPPRDEAMTAERPLRWTDLALALDEPEMLRLDVVERTISLPEGSSATVRNSGTGLIQHGGRLYKPGETFVVRHGDLIRGVRLPA